MYRSARHPLANANYQTANDSPPKPAPPPKAPSSPPLPRQNSKTAPPSPPKVITDKSGRLSFNRVGFLGEVCTLDDKYMPLILYRVALQGCMRLRTLAATDLHARWSPKRHLRQRRRKQRCADFDLLEWLPTPSSCMQRSRFTARWSTPILSASKIVSKTPTTSI